MSKALGKGLEELFSENVNTFQDFEDSIISEAKNSNSVIEISLSDLRPNPYQPRKNFDEESLKELSDSIKEHGVFQPIIVKKSIKGYDIVAGERRFRASQLAGKTTIPAIVKDFSDEEMMQIALLENLQRENLTAIEEAKAYKSIIETMNITQEELAKKVGKSRSHITNILGLLKLPASVQDMILFNKLSMGHDRVLSKLDDASKQEDLANKVIDEDISVRELESMIYNNPTTKVVKEKKKEENEYGYVETYLKEKLGTNVKINNNKMVIKFSSIHDLNRILEIMNINIDE